MKQTILFIILLLECAGSYAQLCPGGGTSFSNAVLWDPSSITGCTSGTSCTGGTTFDNRAACEPTTAIDACAPAPSCALAANAGSDLWFKFYATSPAITINIVQSVSFIASIQAFSGGGTGCGSLTQIGCVVAGGPSTGIALNLTGLVTGNQYYFRIFGTAGSAAQRTGTFCFCGSAGMSNIALPVKLSSFTATAAQRSVVLKWTTSSQQNFSHFELERSSDGQDFKSIGAIPENTLSNIYNFTDKEPLEGNNIYRLKMIDLDGHYEYSGINKITFARKEKFSVITDNVSRSLIIYSDEAGYADVYSTSGALVSSLKLQKGSNRFPLSLNRGTYIFKSRSQANSGKVVVLR